MRLEESLHLQQLGKLAHQLAGAGPGVKAGAGQGVNERTWGGLAAWDRARAQFHVLRAGVASPGSRRHLEEVCLATATLLPATTAPLYLWLSRAPCSNHAGTQRDCLGRLAAWARARPAARLVLGFSSPHRSDNHFNIY